MSLDPNFILQLLIQKRAREQSQMRDDQAMTEQRRQQQFDMVLKLAEDPNFKNIDAALGIAPDLTPPQVDFVRELNKAAVQKRKAGELAVGPGTAPVSPTGGPGGFQPGLEELLPLLRAAEQTAGGDPALLEETVGEIGRRSQESVLAEQAAERASGRIAGRKGGDEGIALRRESLDLRGEELTARREENRLERISNERSKYEKVAKPFLESFDAMQSVDTMASACKFDKNSSACVALAFASAKAADRGGRVTQPDFDVMWRSMAIDDRIKSFMSQHLAGRLTGKKVDELLGVAKATFRKREAEFRRYSDGLEKSLEKQGIDPADVLIARPPAFEPEGELEDLGEIP